MKIAKHPLLWGLLVPAIAAAATYNYFAPGGALSCTGACTTQSVNVGAGASFITGALPEANTVLGTAITPTSLSANTNNYNPTGAATADIWNIASTANIDLTGAVGSTLNRTLTLRNVGSFNITLRDQSASSSAGNRFTLSVTNTDGATTDEVLAPGMAIQLRGTGNGWVPVITGQSFNVDASLNDVLLGKWTGADNLVIDGTAVNGGTATQQLQIGFGALTNNVNIAGNAFSVNNNLSANAIAVSGFNATNNAAVNFLHQLTSSAAAALAPNGPTGSQSLLISEGAPLLLCAGATGPDHCSLRDAAGNFTATTDSNTTSQTSKFFYIPKVAGVPTGVPATLTGAFANSLPLEYDSTDNRLYVYNAAWQAFGANTGAANPTATVGPTAVNGSATTFMRSDAAPAQNLTASYAWTGTHSFSNGSLSTDTNFTVQNAAATAGSIKTCGDGSTIFGTGTACGSQPSVRGDGAIYSTHSVNNGWQPFFGRNSSNGTAAYTIIEAANDTITHEFTFGTTSTTYNTAFATNAPVGEIGFFFTPFAKPICWVQVATAYLCSNANGAFTFFAPAAGPTLTVNAPANSTGINVLGSISSNSTTGASPSASTTQVFMNGGNSATFGWVNGSASADNRIWDSFADSSGILHLRAVNDAYNTAGEWATISRSGMTPSTVKLAEIVSGGTAATVTNFSGGCGTPSSVVAGAQAGKFQANVSGTCAVTITMAAAAPNGWACTITDMSTIVNGSQSGFSATTATMQVVTTSGNTVLFNCMGF